MTDEECQYFKTVTLRNLAKRAQSLKTVRPPRGLSFSLQQQRTYTFWLGVISENPTKQKIICFKYILGIIYGVAVEPLAIKDQICLFHVNNVNQFDSNIFCSG